MSDVDMKTMEGQGSYGKNAYLPSIQSFKQRMNYILFNNKYTAEFSGSDFWNEHSNITRYMISAIGLPQIMIDGEPVYMGGAQAMMPNGFTQGNLELTLYNTGPELQVMQRWMALAYNQAERTYGYFDDIKCDLTINQFTTNGELVQTFKFIDCTPFNFGGMSFTYEPATAPQTFNISLNYYAYSISTDPQFFKMAQLLSNSQKIAEAAARLAKNKK